MTFPIIVIKEGNIITKYITKIIANIISLVAGWL
jgi:hypothetical protein